MDQEESILILYTKRWLSEKYKEREIATRNIW